MALNFDFGDSGGKYLVELENGVLNHTADRQADDADATVTLTRDTLNDIILQQTTLVDAISAGNVDINGDQQSWKSSSPTSTTSSSGSTSSRRTRPTDQGMRGRCPQCAAAEQRLHAPPPQPALGHLSRDRRT